MKATILTLFIALCGCVVPVVTLRDSEISHYAIIEIDLDAWLGDNAKGEFAYISHIDGIWEDQYLNKRAGRLRTDGPLVKYIFIEPGTHDMTLVYNRNALNVDGRKLWSGGITEKASLTTGRYYVKYNTEGNFVTLWLEDAKGEPITEKRRSVIGDATPKASAAIPVIIPK